MKIRSGFVSNSSSASFNVVWQWLENEPDYSVEQAVDKLFEWDGRDEIIDEIKKHTKKLQNNIFETHFFTVMLNCPADLGTAAEAFIFHLYCRNISPSLCGHGTVILKSVLEDN